MRQVNRWILIVAAVLQAAIGVEVMAQGPSKELAVKLMTLPPRPKRPELPASELPLKFLKGERVAFLGNSFAERMNLFGHFETLLHTRFADQELIVRNFARPAEEVGIQQRSADYTALDDPQLAFGADTYFCFFGHRRFENFIPRYCNSTHCHAHYYRYIFLTAIRYRYSR